MPAGDAGAWRRSAADRRAPPKLLQRAENAGPPARARGIVMTDRDTYAAIAAALRFYLAGLYEGAVEKMRRAFNHCCHCSSAPEAALEDSDTIGRPSCRTNEL